MSKQGKAVVKKPPAAGFSYSFAAIGVVLIAMAFLQRVLDAYQADPPAARSLTALLASICVLGATTVGLLIWRWRDARRLLSSLRFAASLLLTLALATMLGTFFVQGQPQPFYAERYGDLATVIEALHLHDVFHSLWYAGLLGLLCCSLVIVVIVRRGWTRPKLGFSLAHLGVVVLCGGGLFSALWAERGRLDMVVGQVAEQFRRNPSAPFEPPVVPLGFGLRLDAFDVDTYEQAYNLRLFERDNSAVAALPAARAAYERGELSPDEWMEHQARTFRFVAAIEAPRIPWEAVEQKRKRGEDPLSLPEKGARLAFGSGYELEVLDTGIEAGGKDENAKINLVYRYQPETGHSVQVESDAPLTVAPGKSVSLSNGRVLEVGEFLPHFNFDIEKRVAVSVSDRPENPALHVRLTQTGKPTPLFDGWLFAKFPGFSMASNEPGHQTTAAAKRPFAEVRVLHNGQVVTGPNRLPAGRESVAIEDGRFRILLQAEEDRIKQFFSTLSVLENGKVVRGERISVNQPLSYGGFMFYQANYDPKNPQYSGIDVVRDPGTIVVYFGFLLVVLGVFHVFLIRRQTALDSDSASALPESPRKKPTDAKAEKAGAEVSP